MSPTHNITCKVCQANSWLYAGRTELGSWLCNGGYELQGGLCVACPVGKARQANYNNSIMCETCVAGTFTSVSASITCQSCLQDCADITLNTLVIADFTGIATIKQKNMVGDIQWPAGRWWCLLFVLSGRSGQKAQLFFSTRLYLTPEPILNQFVQEKIFYYQPWMNYR